MNSPPWTVGRYLARRLHDAGVGHVFGVPGDYVLGFMDDILASPVELVGACNELNAGYAADAYARIRGVGAVCVTYAVGGFSVLNAIAGAFAERVPVIVISGGPTRADRARHRLVHHTLGDYGAQVEIFRHVTELSIGLDTAERAPEQIDHAIVTALRARRPVFIELPTDLGAQPCSAPGPLPTPGTPPSDPATLGEAVAEAAALLHAAERPVLLGGVEVHRFALRAELEALIEHLGVPVATALMGKSVVSETHPQYIGLYCGSLSDPRVRKVVESADCVLSLGAIMSDVNLGIYTADIELARLIHATSDRVQIKHHYFERVNLGDFMRDLHAALPKRAVRADLIPATRVLSEHFEAKPDEPISIRRFFERVNHFLGNDDVVLADAGDSFLCAGELVVHEGVGFVCQAFYCSLGFTLPGALGVALADRTRRPVVFIGDGAFQMTAQELSTLLRNKVNAVVFLMNNQGYTIERVIHDGPYNDIQNWRYHQLPEIFGGCFSALVKTEADLESVLEKINAQPEGLSFVEIELDPLDCSDALRRLGRAIAEHSGLATSSNDG